MSFALVGGKSILTRTQKVLVLEDLTYWVGRDHNVVRGAAEAGQAHPHASVGRCGHKGNGKVSDQALLFAQLGKRMTKVGTRSCALRPCCRIRVNSHSKQLLLRPPGMLPLASGCYG